MNFNLLQLKNSMFYIHVISFFCFFFSWQMNSEEAGGPQQVIIPGDG